MPGEHMTRQPRWKLIANLGDVNPIDYGGFFVYEDTTGAYAPEAELLFAPDDDDSEEPWEVYRFPLDRLKTIEDDETHTIYLVPERYAADWPHAVSQYDEWFHKSLAQVANSIGSTLDAVRADLCSASPIDRAHAYRAIGDYHGFGNLDSYPLTFTDRTEVEARYGEETVTVRQIQTEHVRAHELSDRAVPLPNALDHDKQTRYGVKAKTGMWITYRDVDAKGNVFAYRSGRVLGRVDAPFVAASNPEYNCERIDGYVSVLALSDSMQFAYIRWVNPEDVAEVSVNPPAKLLAWITGPLPDAEMVHKLSHYGTLSESYIDKVDHHINAWKHGVSPSAWDAGVRKDEQ